MSGPATIEYQWDLRIGIQVDVTSPLASPLARVHVTQDGGRPGQTPLQPDGAGAGTYFYKEHTILQIGARNMQNFNLLKDLSKLNKPILLKRGPAATIEETLLSAEYLMSGGNHEVIICERGIKTFETYTRNTLDLNAIPVVKELSHLPVIVDPSHGTGIRDKVAPMARAAIAAGADGLIVEVHHDPDHALSDGAQSLYPAQYRELVDQIRTIAAVVGRRV